MDVELHLINVSGRLEKLVVLGRLSPGLHSLTLDPGDLPSGVYLCRIVSGGKSLASRKLLMVK
jgi:hypothetical protein